jgi:4-hydroxy-2-oxoglutarate aldolase
MQGERFKGIFPPVTTPFKSSGEVDADALAFNISRYNETALAGYVPLGSNGEIVHLSSAEKETVIRTVKRAASPDKTVIAGINELSTVAATEAVNRAAGAGADAALVITPFFYKGSMVSDALARHYTQVADRSPVPVLIYNVPQNTGVVIAPGTVASLAAHPNIFGIKDSSGDMRALMDTIRLSPPGFSVLTGNGAILYPSILMGASGAVLALADLIPDACVRVYEMARAGKHEEALHLQNRLTPLSNLLTAALGIAGLKAALDLAGFRGGLPRLPLLPVSPDQLESIKSAMGSSELFPWN